MNAADMGDRITWLHAEAERCAAVGAQRLAAWCRAEAQRLAAMIGGAQ